MNTTDFELQDVVNFILLNAGFSNNNGLQRGKTAVVLFLMHAQKNKLIVVHPDVVVSYLNEIYSSVRPFDSNNYGEGIAGHGVVLEHLTQAGLLQYDTEEMLIELEQNLIKDNQINTEQIDIAAGLSGVGLYLLHRFYGSAIRKPASENIYKGYLTICVERIVKKHSFYRWNEYLHQVETAIWNGLTGVLLFLNRAKELSIYNEDSEKVETEIINRLLHYVNENVFHWSKAEAYFGLLHCNRVCCNITLRDKVFESLAIYIDNANKQRQHIDFPNAAFVAVLIRLLGRKYKYSPAIELSDEICGKVKATMAEGNLAGLFEYHKSSQTFQMGIYRGLCGTALSLLSVQTEDYRWLRILGIEIN